jgi:hypothetical protein
MALPTSLTELVAGRLERALADAAYWRGAELQSVEGNPLAIDDTSFGRVRARRVGTDLAYYRYFSGPLSLQTGDEAIVPALAAWYAERGAPCFVRLSPLFANADLLRALAQAGLAQTGFMSLLYGEPRPAVATPADQVTVVEVGPGQDQLFLDLWTNDVPENEYALRQRLARAELAHWRRYVAFVDDQPAAQAAMFISPQTRTAVLAAAGTLPALRGRGCQAALVLRRLSDAAAAGCDLVAVEATPGSASQRNLERLGLRLAVTRVLWTL